MRGHRLRTAGMCLAVVLTALMGAGSPAAAAAPAAPAGMQVIQAGGGFCLTYLTLPHRADTAVRMAATIACLDPDASVTLTARLYRDGELVETVLTQPILRRSGSVEVVTDCADGLYLGLVDCTI